MSKFRIVVFAISSHCLLRFQLKLGGDPNTDIERIKACRAVLDSSVSRRIHIPILTNIKDFLTSPLKDVLVGDANTGWTTAQVVLPLMNFKILDSLRREKNDSWN